MRLVHGRDRATVRRRRIVRGAERSDHAHNDDAGCGWDGVLDGSVHEWSVRREFE